MARIFTGRRSAIEKSRKRQNLTSHATEIGRDIGEAGAEGNCGH